MTLSPLLPAPTQSNDSLARRWLLATLLTGVTAVCAQFSVRLPFTPVPLTGQVFPVLLAGLLLGSRWGAVAQMQYLLLGLMGAPVFAEFHRGPAALVGLTAGYLWAFPTAAFVTGWIAESGHRAIDGRISLHRQLLACAAGMTIIYVFGCTWLALVSRPMLSPGAAFVVGAGWFLAWDTVKALAAIAITSGLRRGKRI
jgi:biotin transport system substrate-specific component